MTDDIRAMTAQLAADPASLVFLRLGEALRRRGQLDAAEKVAVGGLQRYPYLPDAHDLLARILVERGDFERAFDEWDTTLRLDPDHPGAHKGIGFLYYKAGDLPAALRHLELAAQASPGDPSVRAAIERVRGGLDVPAAAPVPSSLPEVDAGSGRAGTGDADRLFAGFEGADDGLLLADQGGLRLGGGLRSPDGIDVADGVAAHLAGLAREAVRATRLLGMGGWQSLAAETADANLYLVAPEAETLLLVVRDRSIPMGRLAYLAERAGRVARGWMGGLK